MPRANVPGTVYLIHFDAPLHHAQHYIGWTESPDMESRMKAHRSGEGARILAACKRLGIKWQIVKTWPDADRNFERKLKRRASAGILCPVCHASRHERNMETQRIRRQKRKRDQAEGIYDLPMLPATDPSLLDIPF